MFVEGAFRMFSHLKVLTTSLPYTLIFLTGDHSGSLLLVNANMVLQEKTSYFEMISMLIPMTLN